LAFAEQNIPSNYWKPNNPKNNDWDAKILGIEIMVTVPALQAHIECEIGVLIVENIYTVVNCKGN
jgi:hypothetical protein